MKVGPKIGLFKDNKWESRMSGVHFFKTQVSRLSRITKAPVEGGELASDSKVIDPITITLTTKIQRAYDPTSTNPEHEVFRELAAMADNRDSSLWSVITPDGYYNNLVIESVSSTSSPSEFDLVTCEITLVEMLIIQGEGKNTLSPDNRSISRCGFISS